MRVLAASIPHVALALAFFVSPTAARVGIVQVLGISSGPSPQDTFRSPQDIVVDVDHQTLLVADTGRQRLVVFDATGRCRGAITCSSQSPEDIQRRIPAEPRSLALDGRGRIFLVDVQRNDIQVYSTTGARIASYRPAALDELGPDLTPRAIDCGRSGRLYVLVDGSLTGLLVAENDGTVVDLLGFEGNERAFTGATALAVNGDETTLAVIDTMGELQIRLLDMRGRPIRAFGAHGEGEGTFSAAVSAIWGPGDTLWVTDTLRHSISIFDAEGTYLGRIGGFGDGPGQFRYPSACAFLSATKLAVVERGSSRMQVIELDHDLGDLDAGRPIDVGHQRRLDDRKETLSRAVAYGGQPIEAATPAGFVHVIPSPSRR